VLLEGLRSELTVVEQLAEGEGPTRTRFWQEHELFASHPAAKVIGPLAATRSDKTTGWLMIVGALSITALLSRCFSFLNVPSFPIRSSKCQTLAATLQLAEKCNSNGGTLTDLSFDIFCCLHHRLSKRKAREALGANLFPHGPGLASGRTRGT
jgi:hypothetical protein